MRGCIGSNENKAELLTELSWRMWPGVLGVSMGRVNMASLFFVQCDVVYFCPEHAL